MKGNNMAVIMSFEERREQEQGVNTTMQVYQNLGRPITKEQAEKIWLKSKEKAEAMFAARDKQIKAEREAARGKKFMRINLLRGL
jgi:hypothetical protein